MKKTIRGWSIFVILLVMLGGFIFFRWDDGSISFPGGDIIDHTKAEYQRILSQYSVDDASSDEGGASLGNVGSTSNGGGGGLQVNHSYIAKSSFGNAEVALTNTMNGGLNKSMPISNEANKNIAFQVGADQDIQLFRENIAEGHIPNPDVITYNGVYSDYHFELPDGECDTLFCPLVSESRWQGEEDDDSSYWIQFGLGSSLKEKDFKRPPTDFVVVIDKSGSMGSRLGDYYYDNKNTDYFVEDWGFCDTSAYYFKPGQRCVNKKQKRILEEEMHDLQGQNKLALAMDALTKMVDKLQPDDRIAVVVFDNNARVVHPLIKASKIERGLFKQHLQKISPSGGTNMESGIEEALDLFDDDDSEAQKRIIFLTDAMPNIGTSSPRGLHHYIEQASDDGVYFSFFGVGVDFQQQFVQEMADVEGANYFFVSQYYDLQRRLVDEFDYNFFPMIFDLQAKINDENLVDKVYGLDSKMTDETLMKVKTLFPTPPTANGYRGSIILLKLKHALEESMNFTVQWRTYDGKHEEQEISVDAQDFDKASGSMLKGILLTQYVDALREAIDTYDTEILDHIEKVFENNETQFTEDDHTMREKEIETIEKLRTLLQQGEKVKKDYWKGE